MLANCGNRGRCLRGANERPREGKEPQSWSRPTEAPSQATRQESSSKRLRRQDTELAMTASPKQIPTGFAEAQARKSRTLVRENRRGRTIAQRWCRFVRIGDDCWDWIGATVSGGYGCLMVRAQHRVSLAHRIAWEMFKGPIPAGLVVCHTCDRPQCVNPEHLFLGTNHENILDSVRKGRHKHHVTPLKSHCLRGHPLSGDNLYIRRNGARNCRACHRLFSTIRSARLRAMRAIQS